MRQGIEKVYTIFSVLFYIGILFVIYLYTIGASSGRQKKTRVWDPGWLSREATFSVVVLFLVFLVLNGGEDVEFGDFLKLDVVSEFFFLSHGVILPFLISSFRKRHYYRPAKTRNKASERVTAYVSVY